MAVAAELRPRLAMYAIALRRKLAILLTGDFDPYPPPPAGISLSPYERDRAEAEAAPCALSWANSGGDVRAWQDAARAKLAGLAGWRRQGALPARSRSGFASAEAGPPEAIVRDELAPARHGLNHVRSYLRVRASADVPVHVLWHPAQHWPAPAMICLQGTNAGAHLGWGEARMPPDPVKIAAGLDFALQAAARGFVALCIEQRCFGERRERILAPRSADPCVDAVMHALLLGRTLIGDSAGDVSAVIDWVDAGGPGLDLDRARIYALGHSWGGTVALYAAALDTRIAGVIASGCVGPIRDTVAARRAPSGQNVIPGLLDWLELADVLALCAPRPLLAVSGRADHIFPFNGAERAVAAALPVYRALDAARRLRALALPGGHRFAPEAIWPAFESLIADG